jgi:2-polyprenyl-6-methoxyphenol hydroxylase-like FAD-dependent oxidoreductase
MPRAVIIGGSLSGLFAGALLRSIGWDAYIFERSPHELDNRGGGIVLQPDVIEAFHRACVPYDSSIGVVAKERVYLNQNGGIGQRIRLQQILTSWSTLYNAMRATFPRERYRQDATFVKLEQDANGITAQFGDGWVEGSDLLIGADGSGSTVRQQLLPDVTARYAGYVAWRGLVGESDLPEKAAAILGERFTFYEFPNSHILSYLVPGEHETIEPGRRRYNWVWYRNVDEATELPRVLTDRAGRRHASSVPPGLVALEVETELRSAADSLLPSVFGQLVAATREPFVQAIVDLSVPRMGFGRVALIGDAAFVPRPHTAASTSKAAANALALADALAQADNDVIAALALWEPDQIRLGLHYLRQGKSLGDRSQFSHPLTTVA